MKSRAFNLFTLFALLASLVGSFTNVTPAHAATLIVNTLTDENDGSCLDGDCSLRDAIVVATDNDTITFSVTGTIVLNSVLTVDKSLTITGPGSSQLTLDGNDQHRIFDLVNDTPTNTINISRMTMTKGYADPALVCGGGAIKSWAFLTMDDVVITDNHAPGGGVNCTYPRGGGIVFFDGVGSLTLTNSTVSNNSTYYGGGGIYFSSYNGNISLDNVNVEGNQSTGSDGGGVSIENALATATITNSIISNNDASSSGAGGGGLYLRTNFSNPAVTVENTYISANTANSGGGIYIDNLPLNITNSTIADNSVFNEGGGLYNYNGTVTINSSTIKGNIASGGGTSNGGGIFNLGSDGSGAMTIVNSTLTGNSSTFGKGGAIYNYAYHYTEVIDDIATIDIVNSTIVSNSANGSNGGAGIFVYTAGVSEVSTVTLSNSIVYANTLTGGGTNGENCRLVNSGNIVANNHNLFQILPNDFCNPGVTDVTSTLARPSVVLGLTNNGGTTQTMALPNGSPAIDAGNKAICTAAPVNNASQNGVTRLLDSQCDIGAYETPTPTPLPTGWIGSVTVTSDKIVATVGRPHIGSEIASYDGFSSGALSSYVPMLFKDAFGGSYDAALYVQNVSGSSANVTIKFYDSAGTLSCTKNDTVSPLASKGYWLPSESCLPTGWVGGALITSDQDIVAVGRPHIGSEVMTYNGFSSGSASASIPMLFKDAFGGSYDSAFYIQNVSVSSASLTIQYFDSAGTLNCTKSDTLAPFASKGYWLPSATCDSGSIPVGWVGGVRVTSDQPIVSVGRPHIGSQITTYSGFSAGSTSSTIPMLFKDAFGGSYDAAFYLQNVHAANTANVTIKYYDNTGTLNCTKTDTLAPLASKGYWVPSATCDSGSLPAGWVGGVEVTSDQPIVAVGRPHIGSQVTTYNGFTSGNSSSFLPMLFKDAFGGSYDSAFYVQNTEATQATVTTKFYDSAGALTCSRTDLIPPKATLGIWVPTATCVP